MSLKLGEIDRQRLYMQAKDVLSFILREWKDTISVEASIAIEFTNKQDRRNSSVASLMTDKKSGENSLTTTLTRKNWVGGKLDETVQSYHSTDQETNASQ